MKATTEKIICDAGRAMLDFPEGQRGELAVHVGCAYENTVLQYERDSRNDASVQRILSTVKAELHALGFVW